MFDTSAKLFLTAALGALAAPAIGLASEGRETAAVEAAADSETAKALSPFQAEAEAFVVKLVNDMSAMVKAEQDVDIRGEKLAEILSNRIATAPLSRYVLGSSLRDTLTQEEIASFNDAFPGYIASDYASRIGELVERRIEVYDYVERRPDEVIVRSRIIGEDGQAKADLDWRVRNYPEPEGLKLLDVIVEGVSPLAVKREEVSSTVRREGMETLLALMSQS